MRQIELEEHQRRIAQIAGGFETHLAFQFDRLMVFTVFDRLKCLHAFACFLFRDVAQQRPPYAFTFIVPVHGDRDFGALIGSVRRNNGICDHRVTIGRNGNVAFLAIMIDIEHFFEHFVARFSRREEAKAHVVFVDVAEKVRQRRLVKWPDRPHGEFKTRPGDQESKAGYAGHMACRLRLGQCFGHKHRFLRDRNIGPEFRSSMAEPKIRNGP